MSRIYPALLEDARRTVQFEAILHALVVLLVLAQGRDSVPAERLVSREAYRDAKFGLFIHWGVYSLLGQGEWVMQNRPIAVADYEWLASTFNPQKFDAHAWVSLAKAAGMKYITITSRHHDGFSMFATRATRYNIVDWTPFKRDPLKELADECQRQGIKLFFYYSQLDWHHPDYWPRGTTGHSTGRPEGGDWNRYLDFLDVQLTELLTNYGPIGGIWFDGMWDKPDADWRLPQTYALIHRLQPARRPDPASQLGCDDAARRYDVRACARLERSGACAAVTGRGTVEGTHVARWDAGGRDTVCERGDASARNG